ncbi:MAG: PorT family protein [Bacteroidia bacterium]|nr:PorT family protein [Bacteroidia bacterium]
MRKLLTLFCIGLFPLVTIAQDQKFHFGLKITPSMAWIKPDRKGIEREGYRLGFAYGVQTEFRLAENYAIASGVQVAYRGGKVRFEAGKDTLGADIEDPVNTYKLQYVEIPVSLKMMTKQFDKIRYFGQFGFAPAIRIQAKVDTKNEDNMDAKKATNVFNMNMLIGAGVEYEISGSTVAFAALEFSNGFFDVFDGDAAKGVTNCLGVNLGILF